MGESPDPVVAPRDASTVVLVRNANPGVVVWMLRRISSLAFAPGAWVFPGGAALDVDRPQQLPEWPVRDPVERAAILGVDRPRAGALHEAAVRETFEECGLALARRRADGQPVTWSDDDRNRLLAGTQSLTALLRRDGARIDAEHLVPWDRWLTPEWSARRYDTWFFLVDAQRWPSPVHVPDGEAVTSDWVDPGHMLKQWSGERGALLPPTLACLRRLAAVTTVEDLLADAGRPLVQRSG
jgi:8-oxo-dGTP pyrophosphatase MutT (NUDIX family)